MKDSDDDAIYDALYGQRTETETTPEQSEGVYTSQDSNQPTSVSFVSPTKLVQPPLPSAISTLGHHTMHHVHFEGSKEGGLSPPSTGSNGPSSPYINSPLDAALLKRKQKRLHLDSPDEAE